MTETNTEPLQVTTFFEDFEKIARLNREMVITEKIDGTNAQIAIGDDGSFAVGSRTRWITPENDNHGFARWAYAHKDELITGLGPGRHYGEWWGSGIQRGYGLKNGEKRFSLFNTGRWNLSNVPACCSVVPEICTGLFDSLVVKSAIDGLIRNGSIAAPGFMNPEGVVVYHTAARLLFKVTCVKDESPKSLAK
jgi:hypothetical protein